MMEIFTDNDYRLIADRIERKLDGSPWFGEEDITVDISGNAVVMLSYDAFCPDGERTRVHITPVVLSREDGQDEEVALDKRKLEKHFISGISVFD